MGLRLILGRAGTGKTYTCLQEISEECRKSPLGAQLLLIVPEQATFRMEYELNTAFGVEGTMRVQVQSWRRLAYRVLAQAAPHEIPVSSLRKQLELAKILKRREPKLKLLRQSAGEPGLSRELANFLDEMKSYHINANKFREKAEALYSRVDDKLASEKLIELADLYADWEAEGLVDPASLLDLAANSLRETDIYKDAKVWIDGFVEFTPQEFGLIGSLLAVAQEVNVTLCYNSEDCAEKLSERDLFYPTDNTLRRLLELAGRSRLSPETDSFLQTRHRYLNFPAGAIVEECFVKSSTLGMTDSPRQLSLQAAVNRRAELEGVAREIVRLCREEHYRWRDICVISRDLSLYQDLFPVIFTEYGIPYYLDEPYTLSQHPLAELIRSALEVVSSDWSYAALFRCLKTDLVPLTREQVDRLENYALEHGIRGTSWFETWTFTVRSSLGEDETVSSGTEKTLEYLNRLRTTALKALQALQLALEQGENARDYSLAIISLMEELKIRKRLAAWSEEDGTETHRLAWEKVLDLLDTIVQTLGERKISLPEYNQVLISGLENLVLPRRLPGMDEVLICPPDKCFDPGLKAAFVIGLNEGVMPGRIGFTGLLTEKERTELRSLGLNLGPGARARAFKENFIVYLALTRASERLWLSYSLADLEGKAQRPSPIVRRLKEIFPRLQECLLEHKPSLIEREDYRFVAEPKSALHYLADILREHKQGAEVPPLWLDVYNWALDQPQWREKLAQVVKGLQYQNIAGPLGKELARELYGAQLKLSVTRIEKYQACPFAHFVRYGLKLKERQQFGLDSLATGDLFHSALKQIGLRLQDLGLDWADLSDAQCREFSAEAIEELAPQFRSEILLSSERYKYLTTKLTRVLNASTRALSEQARRGGFRSVGYEISFGTEAELPTLVYPLANDLSLELEGRIDRLDTATDSSGRKLVRVIDYKSGNPSLTLDDMYYGLKLQLLTYQEIAVRAMGPDAVPAGFFYFYLSNPLVSGRGPMPKEERDKQLLRRFQMKGFVLEDLEVIRLTEVRGERDVIPVRITNGRVVDQWSSVLNKEQYQFFSRRLEKMLQDAALEMLEGNISINPYSKGNVNACIYCKLKPLCGFDPLLPENRFRNLKVIPNKVFWQLVRLPEGSDTANDRSQMDS